MDTNFKVLMALMGLEIGGAETHVLELCKTLKSKGAEVIIVSNGGAYVKELEDFGIVHHNAPLHNKNVHNIIKSYKIIENIIIDNDIKLVHAHARIPAFICGLLQKNLKKKYPFRFVTTAHWIFKATFPLNVLTNWGEQSLAVSHDIKDYLIKNYDVPKENIIVTINGIDINKFSGEVDYKYLLEEFSLDENSYKILYVSRMDKDRSLAAHKLIEIAEELYKFKANIEIIIVGGGNDFQNIVTKSKEVNSKIGKRIVVLTDARVDINAFVASCDLFVGVSRSALEAMAASKPVIVGGNEGYIGVFDEKNLDVAVETNFCCRDCVPISKELLLQDIIDVINKPAEEITHLGEYGLEIIKKYYSTEKMAKDAIDMYEKVRYPMKKPIDAMISGYYGFDNNGDDVVLKAIVDNLKNINPDINILVLSKKPKQTKEIYSVDSINRFNFFSIYNNLSNTTMLINGGGSLIQDLTSTHSIMYYLFIIKMALMKNVKVMIYANGIGPVRKEANKKRVSKVLNQVDLITLRDDESFETLKKLGVVNSNIHVTVDAAFGIKKTVKNSNSENDGKYFCVAIRNWKYGNDDFEIQIAKFCDFIKKEYNLSAVFVPMQPTNDTLISKKVMELMQEKSVFFKENYSIDELFDIVGNAEFILGMRLHTIIYAIGLNVPVVGISYDPKVSAFMEKAKQMGYIDIQEVKSETLIDMAKNVIENREKIIQDIKVNTKDFENKAMQNTEFAYDLLNGKEF